MVVSINLHHEMHRTSQVSALSYLLQVHLILALVKHTVYGPGYSASILGQTECLVIYSNDKT